MLVREVLTIAAAVALAAMPMTVAACDGLVDGPRGRVASVTDGDTVVLDSDIVVRLIGTQAPKLPLGREDFETWPKAEESRVALERLVLGKQVVVRHGGERVDRHGRTLGQLFITAPVETWVQQQMVADGWARVYSFPDNRACVPQLLAVETQARLMKLGIWADPYYFVRRAGRPADFAGRAGRYELVEGRVLMADEAQGRVYLNFGRSWKEDFTAVIDKAALQLFSRGGLDPLRLDGALVRIRGWVDENDGPRVEITHPEQIEVLRAP
ncbi:thermonuclease family protein [Devosia sp. ZB163]|uniref:thermonuclease family protein n=1 Tax=Devosia sp. ZB163 TaxID=3025938 RepID=UPI00235DF24E|nr:thermonuclease family protein [Devosia sp. ZB163]MDC9826507.1 thermonuclease family protein [Devosia sp. ZB163]